MMAASGGHGVSGDAKNSNKSCGISGPHAGFDRYGNLDHYYFTCETCGREAIEAGEILHKSGCENGHSQ